jgi:hypothetical protein
MARENRARADGVNAGPTAPSRIHALRAQLSETIRRAALILETSRTLHRVSIHRREMRRLSNAALRPQ